MKPEHLEIAPEVQAALDAHQPIVALESTLIAHGLPEEHRLDVARRIESTVRENGALPATIAVMDGKFRVGLDDTALARLAHGVVHKASVRDLAFGIVQADRVFATTVASTMAIAHTAGIRVFATGGIGGVHRFADQTFDESADLVALSRYPVLVVCAGPKAVLDLPKTMERLETLGVPVVGFDSEELPAFYTRTSGLKVPHAARSASEVVALFSAHLEVGGRGFLVTNPPPESAAWDPDGVERLIHEALSDAARQKVEGAEVTPYLLSRLDRASHGQLVATNIALVVDNARVAALLAVADSAA